MKINNKGKNSEEKESIVSGNFSPGYLSLFCYQLSLIFKSGIPFLEGIHIFAEEMADSKFKKISQALYQDVFQGMTLHSSLERQKCFPSYMVNMIRIAEATGTLDKELEHLSDYYDKADKLSRRIRNAITYPIILAIMMGCIILMLIFKILPMFHEILVSAGGDIPPITQAILNFSIGVSDNYIIVVLVILLLAAALIILTKTASGKRKWDEFKVRAPLIKTINLKVISARFSMGMAMLLKSGIAFDDALSMVWNIIGNTYVAQKVVDCQNAIRNGTDTAESFSKIGIFPALFVKMLNIGHKTGELEKSLDKIAGIYENEVDRYMSRVTSAIEPVMVIVLSVIVGIILLAVMLPLISIMSSIG